MGRPSNFENTVGKSLFRLAVVNACLRLLDTTASAHFSMLLPEAASVKRGEAVSIVYQWGHPFEHQLFDAPAPEALFVLGPDGKRTDLSKSLEKTTVATGDAKKVSVYRLRFTAEQRGDYVFVLQSAPIWMEEDQEFLVDTVKVVLHVQAQMGWDRSAETAFEVLPLTRPYGLQAGMAFQAQVLVIDGAAAARSTALAAGKSFLAGERVEIERYNAAPPKDLPADEHITRVAKTDPNGVVTCTLTEPGWWCITAQRDGGKRESDGKAFPVRQRSTLWVFVDDKPAK